MALLVGSVVVFLFTSLALGIGVIFNAKPVRAGCRGLPGNSNIDPDAPCDNCGRRN